MKTWKKNDLVVLKHFGRVVAQGEIVHERIQKGGFVVQDAATGELVTRYPADSMEIRPLSKPSFDFLRTRGAY